MTACRASLPLVLEPGLPPASSLPLEAALAVHLLPQPPEQGLFLHLSSQGLALCQLDPGTKSAGTARCVRVDCTEAALGRRLRQPGRELLVKAAKVRGREQALLIDATAGLGRDGMLLAAAGFRVLMLEAHPVVAALLADGLERGRKVPGLEAAMDRIELRQTDALAVLPALTEQPDVIYLDPMFPQRSKSALVKQELRLLQQLNPYIGAPEVMLCAALAVQPRKVVVKRPLKAEPLANLPPAYTVRGKAVRFDVYVGSGKGMVLAPSSTECGQSCQED